MGNFGRDYAELYDSLNAEKDYEREAAFVISRTVEATSVAGQLSLLDIGCGTGRHLEEFGRSFSRIAGVDRSSAMLDVARRRVPGAHLEAGDATAVSFGGTFDVVTALFDVLSYQISNHEAVEFLRAIARHLAPSGVALVDFWHLAGLVVDPPQVRLRRGHVDDREFLRVSSPSVDWASATTNVSMTTIEWKGADLLGVVDESHRMRAFLVAELAALASQAGLQVDRSGGWLVDREATAVDWHAYVTLRHAR